MSRVVHTPTQFYSTEEEGKNALPRATLPLPDLTHTHTRLGVNHGPGKSSFPFPSTCRKLDCSRNLMKDILNLSSFRCPVLSCVVATPSSKDRFLARIYFRSLSFFSPRSSPQWSTHGQLASTLARTMLGRVRYRHEHGMYRTLRHENSYTLPHLGCDFSVNVLCRYIVAEHKFTLPRC